MRSLFVIPDVSICHCSNHAKEEQGGISDLVADLSLGNHSQVASDSVKCVCKYNICDL